MFKKELLRLEFHQLVNYGPSLLNRDQSGNVKEIKVGGVRRVRISGPSYKSAMRNYGPVDAIRTRRLFTIIADRLYEFKNEDGTNKYSEEYVASAIELLKTFFGAKSIKKTKEGETITATSITYSKEYDIQAIVDFFTENYETAEAINKVIAMKDNAKKKDEAYAKFYEGCKNRKLGAHISMYGRMVVDAICEPVESAICMNHAYTINQINGDTDYFAAIEEYVKTGERTGASMLDTTNIESGCFYRYASVDMNTLFANLCIGEDLTEEGVIEKINQMTESEIIDFFEKFLKVAPVAKQHSSATSPNPIITCVRISECGYPTTMDDVFEKAITRTSRATVAEQGIEKFSEFMTDDTYETIGLVKQFVIMNKNKKEFIDDSIEILNEKEAKQTLRDYIKESLQ